MKSNQLILINVVKFVAAANLLYFFVEFWFASRGNSVSLFADSIDFLEDASVNILILMALSWPIKSRLRVAKVLAFVLLLPSIGAAWAVIGKIQSGIIPSSASLTLVGIGALAVNSICAFRLAKVRHKGGSLMKAAYFSARNDMIANIAIIVAGIVTSFLNSYWPDLIVGIGIAIMNADAAREILKSAKEEGRLAEP